MSDDLQDKLVRDGRPGGEEARQVNMPLELGSTVLFNTMQAFETARDQRYESGVLFYGRYGNAASYELEGVLSRLEGAAGTTLTSSGVAAISLSLQSLVQTGSHLLVADNVYGNTRAFCSNVLERQGVVVEYFDPAMGAAVADLFRDNTSVVMFEAPGTGTFEFPDIEGIASAARAASVVSVLDSSWATPLFCQPLNFGVDVVVYSGSKYISGHSDCMFGVIAAARQPIHDQIRRTVMAYGDKIGSQEVFLALRGIRTLHMRMQTVNKSGLAVAQWLASQLPVQRVLHPALDSCPGHEYWKKYCRGSGGLFAVIFKPCADEKVTRFVEALHHFGIGVSWGGFESLVLPVKPVRTATPWPAQGQLVRFNIGFENPRSLIDDLQQALPLLD